MLLRRRMQALGGTVACSIEASPDALKATGCRNWGARNATAGELSDLMPGTPPKFTGFQFIAGWVTTAKGEVRERL